ncbi:hypothetical protein [Okeania sp. SIO2B3]|nr:hypothetical protein [Okeania sp. SIO2B3]NET41597.1 hypothetical protein [Okeania sp. SIO2B3]
MTCFSRLFNLIYPLIIFEAIARQSIYNFSITYHLESCGKNCRCTRRL